jgi:hypothetical protein
VAFELLEFPAEGAGEARVEILDPAREIVDDDGIGSKSLRWAMSSRSCSLWRVMSMMSTSAPVTRPPLSWIGVAIWSMYTVRPPTLLRCRSARPLAWPANTERAGHSGQTESRPAATW